MLKTQYAKHLKDEYPDLDWCGALCSWGLSGVVDSSSSFEESEPQVQSNDVESSASGWPAEHCSSDEASDQFRVCGIPGSESH